MSAAMLLSPLTIDALQAEALRAHLKHGDYSILNPGMAMVLKLAALGEEFGEVCEALTYDKDSAHLVVELIQLANVALSWVQSLEGGTPPSVSDVVYDRIGGSSVPS